jgi:2-haloacid dehalogenase
VFRRIVAMAVLVAAGGGVLSASRIDARATSKNRPEHKRYTAVAFDYFALFNPDSIVSAAEQVLPGKGRALAEIWRNRQFEYSWLRSITHRYIDFLAITDDALTYAASVLQVEVTAAQRHQLLDAYLHLAPWPDTADALRALRKAGVQIITIANLSPLMLRSNADNAGLTPLFDALISTDAKRTYKPDPSAYQLGLDRLHLAKEDIVFVAFAGWDAAGAKSFGYPTVWVNRFNQPVEQLGVQADRTVANLSGLLDFVLNTSPAVPQP